MKKLFHLMIAGVLVLSITGCGKSETSRTRNVVKELTQGHNDNILAHLAGGINTPRIRPRDYLAGKPVATVQATPTTSRAALSRSDIVINANNRPTSVKSNAATKTVAGAVPPGNNPATFPKTALKINPPPALPPPRLPPRNFGTSNTKPVVGATKPSAATKPVAGPTKPGLGSKAAGLLGKGLKGLGKAGLTGMVTNALALVPPIPGMPPELGKILGFGGAEDTSILDAIAAIEEHLVKIDEKLAEISDQISSVQQGVNTALGLLNYIITQNKCSTLASKYDQLSELTLAINEQWKILYGDSANAGLQTQIVQRMVDKYGDDELASFAFAPSDSSQLAEVKRVLIEFKIDLAVQRLGQILLSSNSQPGLLASVQACQAKRFLSSSDSDANAAVILEFTVLLEKAATLQLWSKAYGITPFPTAAFNRVLLDFSNINDKLAVLGKLRIPDGQVLDTATNKMWAHGKDNVRLVQAMNGCPDTDVQNIAEVMLKTGEKTGTLVQEVLKCVSSTAIDMPMTDRTDWRLPAIYEISQQDTTKVNWQGQSGFPDSRPDKPAIILDALFKGWSADICGVSRRSKCESPSQYLIDNGASWLVNPETKLTDVVGTGKYDAHTANGLIWSSTSMAAASGSLPWPRATASNIVLENDKSLTIPRSWAGFNQSCLGCGGNDWGFNKQHIAKYLTGDSATNAFEVEIHSATCNSLYGADEQRVGGGTYRGNCWDNGSNQICNNSITSSSLPRGTKFTYGDTPFPHTFASVRTADLTAIQGKEQVHAIAMANTWGASMDCVNTKDTSNFWSGCCQYTQTSQSVSFPEYARTLYVRDLKPDEFYTFADEGGYLREVALLAAITPPAINVVAVGGQFNVLSKFNVESRGDSARCSLDPATAPTSFDTFQPSDLTCSVGSQISLKPGWHTIYAMAKSASGLVTELVTEETFFEGTPPPKANFNVTPRTNAIAATLTAPRNPDYEYEATASDGTTKKTCKIITTTCTISELVNNVPYALTITTFWGAQSSLSEEKPTMTFGSPPAFNCTVLAEDEKVTLNCSSPREPGNYQTPVAKYVVKNGSNVPVDCDPAKDCVINGLQNSVNTNLEVVATNDFGNTSQPIKVRSIGRPEKPTGVVVSGSDGKIYVSWNRESTGDAAVKYVATATNVSASYSCISKQTMNAGIMTSPAPTECVITVPRINSNLSYAVAVKGGNGNCSDSSTTCNYSESVEAATTVSPQFNPDRPTLVAEVKDSKITVTATPATEGGSTNKITIVSSPIGLSCEASKDTGWKCPNDLVPTRGQIYTFTGTGYNANNVPGAPGTSNAVTVYATPAAPVISQTNTYDGKIMVKIESSTDVIDSYTVTASPGDFTCQISKPNQSCEVTGLTNLKLYSVSATAQNNGGVSVRSSLVSGLKPFGVPKAGSAPTVTLDTAGGSAVFHASVIKPEGEEITEYVVQMVNVDKRCTMMAPDLKCDIPVDESFIGFGLQFTFTATNRIGSSSPSLPSKTIEYERAPLAPIDVILTTINRDIKVEILQDPDSSVATKFSLTASPGNYSPICTANGTCVLRDAAGGKVYTLTMKAINASGTSPASSRLYYLTAPPEAPAELTTSASSAGLVVELAAGKTPTDTASMLVTATPSSGGAPLSCIIILPAKTCAIESDPTKTYKISAVGEATIGEEISASKSFKSTGVVKTIAAATQNLVAPVATLRSSTEVTAAPQINKTIILGKKSTSKIKIDAVYSAFLKSVPVSAGKVSLLKFTGKVKSDSKKICKTKGSDVILLKKGVCNISAKVKVVENKKSKTVELSAKITVR